MPRNVVPLNSSVGPRVPNSRPKFCAQIGSPRTNLIAQRPALTADRQRHRIGRIAIAERNLADRRVVHQFTERRVGRPERLQIGIVVRRRKTDQVAHRDIGNIGAPAIERRRRVDGRNNMAGTRDRLHARHGGCRSERESRAQNSEEPHIFLPDLCTTLDAKRGGDNGRKPIDCR
jgi:hypothetical protein